MNIRKHAPALMLLLVVTLFAACGSDPVQPETTGSISVVIEPESLDASWQLFGPSGFNEVGSGAKTFEQQPAGDYIITWGRPEGWFPPDPLSWTQALTAGETLSFVGEFHLKSTIVVMPDPESIAAPWHLEGPDGWTLDGTGETSILDRDAGSYQVTWQALDNYDLPVEAIQQHDLLDGEIHTFVGQYGVRDGSISIATSPVDVASEWTLVGPDGFMREGAGTDQYDQLTPGTYYVTWTDTEGWLEPGPNPQEIELRSDQHVTLEPLFVPISPYAVISNGVFQMGGPLGEEGSEQDERPVHRVTLTRDILFATTEVTNIQYMTLAQWAFDSGLANCDGLTLTDAFGSGRELLNMADDHCAIAFADGVFSLRDIGWGGLNPDNPVALVSWYGAVMYGEWMNLFSGLPRSYDEAWICNGGNPYGAAGYRLPTEAEWEYACRAGTTTGFYNGEVTNQACNDPVLDESGWYCGNADDRLHGVGLKLINPWGLYDMHGNVFEWCNDTSDTYSSANQVDPVGPVFGTQGVLRGGAAYSEKDKALNNRSANRSSGPRSQGSRHIGIRIVRTAPVSATSPLSKLF